MGSFDMPKLSVGLPSMFAKDPFTHDPFFKGFGFGKMHKMIDRLNADMDKTIKDPKSMDIDEEGHPEGG